MEVIITLVFIGVAIGSFLGEWTTQ